MLGPGVASPGSGWAADGLHGLSPKLGIASGVAVRAGRTASNSRVRLQWPGTNTPGVLPEGLYGVPVRYGSSGGGRFRRRVGGVIGKGGNAEPIGWETATARLLPHYLAGRNEGPLFLFSLAPAPSRQPAAADAEPRTGRARLSYRRAAEVFRTASGGWTLHQLRHSRLTHLAEAGVAGPLLMAKSRHGSVRR